MPKYCVRDDGAVYPYSKDIAANGRFKVVDELPTAHVDSIEAAKKHTQTRVDAAVRMRADQDARHAALRARGQQMRTRVKEQAVDPEAAKEAQRQVDEFAGKTAEPEAPKDDTPFVISTASKEELMAFAQKQFDVSLAKNMKLENMRAKVANLAGVTEE